QVILPSGEFSSDTARLAFLREALGAVERVPGVVSAGFTSQLPLSGEVDGYGFEWASLPNTAGGEAGSALRYAVTPSYFAAMRIPLRRGRLLDASDRAGTGESIVINESLAKRLFGDRDPVGERVRFGPEMGGDHWDVVVGVAGDVRQYGLAVPAPDAFYVAQPQWRWVDNAVTVVVRASTNPLALAPSLKRAIWSVNRGVPIQRVEPMREFVAASAGQRRFVLLAIEAFAITALLLAAIGLYGVISGGVNERIREIGIRSALGAEPGDMVRSVVRRALALTAIGGVIGLIGALLATRLLSSLLFGVSRADPLSYAIGLGALAAVAVIAAWGPARRAARVDPTVALRAE
ncbi:MAG: FtsX-like permease family protein, partial [Gemmatimonadales bacterium]